MIINNVNALQIFLVTFLAMSLNVILPTILFIKAKSASKDKKSFIKNLIFFVIIPELIFLLLSIYGIYKVVMINLSKLF
ncbi:hypothetical protein HLB30_00745 [Peptostreptococcus russellii]|uniref:hypothetical protein n=1 Tax=Peptostreptococcus russellii TaxID=215200 RepID=UPI0016261ABB|nr:hypothetical protein [Peptostreptococcus russellii]MBC2577040.1 hypothetical protein [Peptostreptococcus russellii]